MLDIILQKLWILEFLEISTLLNHSVTTDYSADSTLILFVISFVSFVLGYMYLEFV